jgi:hypothetical protein
VIRARHAAAAAVVAALAALPGGLSAASASGAAERAVVLELRGRAGTREADKAEDRPDGVAASGGLGTIRWSSVRAVRGATGKAVDRWLAAGEDLWRGRERVLRGDWALAAAPLERAFVAWEGSAPCPDALLAAVGCAEARLRDGRAPEAVRPAFEAVRLLRAGARDIEPGDGSAFVDAQRRLLAGPAPVPVGLPPLAFDADGAARVRAAMAGFDTRGDEVLGDALQAYVAALDGSAAAPRRRVVRPSDADRPALEALEAFRSARSADAGDRSQAIARLRRGRRAAAPFGEESGRLALGLALAADEHRPLREAGLLLLASVAAAPDRSGPALAARAGSWFAAPPRAAGHAAEPGLSRDPAIRVPREAADATAGWLAARGEADLMLALLESQLASGSDDAARTQAVARLAGLLAERLEREDDEARRAELAQRALGVVDRAAAGAEALRLAVFRAQFRSAQRSAEARRAGRAGDAASGAARAELRSLAERLGDLARDASRLQSADAREAQRSSGARAEELLDGSARAEQAARSATYFGAWASYYAAWLGRELGAEDWRSDAAAAVRAFASLLDPDRPVTDPGEVSEDLRGSESFASAILGMGLSNALLDEGPAAERWLSLLDAPGTSAAVQVRLPFWRLAAALDRGDFGRALALLRADEGGPESTAMCVVAAARSAGAPASADAAALLAESVGRLASAGRLRELAGLSFGAGDAQGPAARLLSAVRSAAEAARLREAGDRAGAEARWVAAEEDLREAAGAGAMPSVAAGAAGLRAHVLRNLGRMGDAAAAFLEASASMQGEAAADARWSAVLCLDEAARAGDLQAARARDAQVDAVIAALPRSRAAVRAYAWRALAAAEPSAEDIDALLGDAVPFDLAPAARRAAAEALHRRFRAATGPARDAAARRALEAGDGAAFGGEGGMDELRRRSEMALAVGDLARLAASLDTIESRIGDRPPGDPLVAEVAVRRVQLASLEGRYLAALEAVDRMGAGEAAAQAAATLLRAAVADRSSDPAVRAAAARALVGAARPVPPWAVAAWLDAESELLAAGRGGVDRAAAEQASRAAREDAPGDVRLALADARLRLASGDAASAEVAVAGLLSRIATGTPEWLVAKELQVLAASATDVARARALLEQARALTGGFGDGPEGDRLRTLGTRMQGAVPQEVRP